MSIGLRIGAWQLSVWGLGSEQSGQSERHLIMANPPKPYLEVHG